MNTPGPIKQSLNPLPCDQSCPSALGPTNFSNYFKQILDTGLSLIALLLCHLCGQHLGVLGAVVKSSGRFHVHSLGFSHGDFMLNCGELWQLGCWQWHNRRAYSDAQFYWNMCGGVICKMFSYILCIYGHKYCSYQWEKWLACYLSYALHKACPSIFPYFLSVITVPENHNCK